MLEDAKGDCLALDLHFAKGKVEDAEDHEVTSGVYHITHVLYV